MGQKKFAFTFVCVKLLHLILGTVIMFVVAYEYLNYMLLLFHNIGGIAFSTLLALELTDEHVYSSK